MLTTNPQRPPTDVRAVHTKLQAGDLQALSWTTESSNLVKKAHLSSDILVNHLEHPHQQSGLGPVLSQTSVPHFLLSQESTQHQEGLLSPAHTVCPSALWEALQDPLHSYLYITSYTCSSVTLHLHFVACTCYMCTENGRHMCTLMSQ